MLGGGREGGREEEGGRKGGRREKGRQENLSEKESLTIEFLGEIQCREKQKASFVHHRQEVRVQQNPFTSSQFHHRDILSFVSRVNRVNLPPLPHPFAKQGHNLIWNVQEDELSSNRCNHRLLWSPPALRDAFLGEIMESSFSESEGTRLSQASQGMTKAKRSKHHVGHGLSRLVGWW